ncbi:MAG: hypothetical protein MR663_08930 [Lachnospiraceae bacterium]|nr:hypothetical protein [Lachnospiraceae bacterium]
MKIYGLAIWHNGVILRKQKAFGVALFIYDVVRFRKRKIGATYELFSDRFASMCIRRNISYAMPETEEHLSCTMGDLFANLQLQVG